MYHPTTRLLTILELLQAREGVSGTQLAQSLEISPRSVRRYVMMLQDMGIPVQADRGRYGMYRLRPGYKLPPLMFSENEALALTLGLMTLRQANLTGATLAIEGALSKIERVMPVALRQRVQFLQQVIEWGKPLNQPETNLNYLLLLSTAVNQKQPVFITYQADNQPLTERRLDPYGLVNWANRWYVAGYCHLRQALRVFRLDRMTELALLEGAFDRPSNFDSLEFLLHSIETMLTLWEVEVLLEISPVEAQKKVPRIYGSLEVVAEGVIHRTTTDNLRDTAYFLINLKCPFTIIKPPELRTTLHQIAQELLNR
jgi:predicted DNA-binding transcriptional regulator YafY